MISQSTRLMSLFCITRGLVFGNPYGLRSRVCRKRMMYRLSSGILESGSGAKFDFYLFWRYLPLHRGLWIVDYGVDVCPMVELSLQNSPSHLGVKLWFVVCQLDLANGVLSSFIWSCLSWCHLSLFLFGGISCLLPLIAVSDICTMTNYYAII